MNIDDSPAPASDFEALIWRLECASADCPDTRHLPALQMAAFALRALNELSTYVMSAVWTQQHQSTLCGDAEHARLLREAADAFNLIDTMIPDGLRYLGASNADEINAIRTERLQRLGDELVRRSNKRA